MQKEAVVQDRLVQHEREYSMLFYTCNFIATKIEAQALEEKRSVYASFGFYNCAFNLPLVMLEDFFKLTSLTICKKL